MNNHKWYTIISDTQISKNNSIIDETELLEILIIDETDLLEILIINETDLSKTLLINETDSLEIFQLLMR
jgi:hypothetical protein